MTLYLPRNSDAVRYDACRRLGKEATFYDGMITCSTLPGRAVCGAQKRRE